MWACPCGLQNEEDALACVSCGKEREPRESAHEEYPSMLKEIEDAQRELEEVAYRVGKEPVPTPKPTHTLTSDYPHKKTEERERLPLDMDIEEPAPSVYSEIEDLGKELGETPLAARKGREAEEEPYEEFIYEEPKDGSAVKKVLRIVDIVVACIIIVFVAVYAFVQIGGIKEAGFAAYLSKCLGIWVRSIIITQAVLIIGGIIYFVLYEPNETKLK